MLLACLVLSACGDGGDELVTEPPPAAEPTTQGTPESFETAPAPSDEDGQTPEETACAAFAGVANEACVLSYDLCSVVTPAAVAEEYGGDPAIPADVARAYSEQNYVLEARQGAAAGCEDGFASQDQGE
jgi:hypothetical protein